MYNKARIKDDQAKYKYILLQSFSNYRRFYIIIKLI